jgi:hypothetical protein
MANPTLTLIASNTVGSGGASSVTFSSIPQTYTDLKVIISARSNRSNVYDGVYATFNSITSGYTDKLLYGTGSSAGSSSPTSTTSAFFGDTDAASTTGNTFSNQEIYIPNYTSSNPKSYSIDSVQENNATTAYAEMDAGLWTYTGNPAINNITLSLGAGNFVQYSDFYLYGISNS